MSNSEFERLKVIRYGKGRGWSMESLRHSLAARGVRTTGLSKPALQRIQFQLEDAKKRELASRRGNRNLLRVLEQYLLWRRTRRGVGGVYSLDDIRLTKEQILRSGDPYSIEKVNQLWDKIQSYERAGFEPAYRPPKLERAYSRALDKLKTKSKLTHLETRALMKMEGKPFVQKLIERGQPMPKPRVLARKTYKPEKQGRFR